VDLVFLEAALVSSTSVFIFFFNLLFLFLLKSLFLSYLTVTREFFSQYRNHWLIEKSVKVGAVGVFMLCLVFVGVYDLNMDPSVAEH
jgi:hypothetical protein